MIEHVSVQEPYLKYKQMAAIKLTAQEGVLKVVSKTF